MQTPFHLPEGCTLRPGDIVLCRPAKAGEVTEHFPEILGVQEGAHGRLRLTERFPTYRGLGKAFH